MEITEQEFQAATLRGEEIRRRGYAVRADYDSRQNRLVVDLNTGVTIMVPVALIEELSDADANDLTEIEISPAGTALHWPRIDADVYVPSLIQGIYGTKRWMAAQLGAAGGRATSPAKSTAARANGAKGGRPRKRGAS
jgi:protein involved in temperature-dependent protein secretion